MRLSQIILLIVAIIASFSFASVSQAETENNQNSSVFWFPKQKIMKKQIERSKDYGLRAYSFAKVGDSNSDFAFSVYGLGCGPVQLPDSEQQLNNILDIYKSKEYPTSWNISAAYTQYDCPDSNPFSRLSAATRAGLNSDWPSMTLGDVSSSPSTWGWADPRCNDLETPVGCEIRLMRPRYVIIAIGSNDVAYKNDLDGYTSRIKSITDIVRSKGSIPVLMTLSSYQHDNIDPITGLTIYEWVEEANKRLIGYARKNDISYLDFSKVLRNKKNIINYGLSEKDDVHLSFGPGEDMLADSVDFSNEGLRYGANLKNLYTLKLLNRLDRIAKAKVKTDKDNRKKPRFK